MIHFVKLLNHTVRTISFLRNRRKHGTTFILAARAAGHIRDYSHQCSRLPVRSMARVAERMAAACICLEIRPQPRGPATWCLLETDHVSILARRLAAFIS